MAINFPNRSRSYETTRRAIHFWGHDRSMESSFFVSTDALRKIEPDVEAGEAGCLRAFDSNRALIEAAAARIYARGRRGSYDLSPGDFA